MTNYEQLITQSEETVKAESLQFVLAQSKLNLSTGINNAKGEVLKAESELAKVNAIKSQSDQQLINARRAQPIDPQSLVDAYVVGLEQEDKVKAAESNVEFYKGVLSFLESQEKELFSEVK